MLQPIRATKNCVINTIKVEMEFNRNKLGRDDNEPEPDDPATIVLFHGIRIPMIIITYYCMN